MSLVSFISKPTCSIAWAEVPLLLAEQPITMQHIYSAGLVDLRLSPEVNITIEDLTDITYPILSKLYVAK